ncbi:MAG: hypothetical protein ISS81_03255 [Candidatus Marinimicrobia bacterium]|nr:hypothetical protein [Candidatus Neomarinimicrobiota bacterium]
MIKKIKQFLILILFLGIVTNIRLLGQAEFQFTLQSWATYTTYEHSADSTTTQLGFGIRRARLRGKMTKGKATGFVQYDAYTGNMMDAQIDYSLTENIKIRMGRFVGAGSQAGGHTSHTAIDFAERSIVGRLWASAVGRSDYRTYGFSLMGKVRFLDYQVLAQNGDGFLNLKPYGTKSSNSDKDTGSIPQLDFLVSTKLYNGISMGLHYGLPNENRINISSMTGFFYIKPNDYSRGKLRGKFDFARVDSVSSGIVTLGYAIKCFYKLTEKIEIGAGYERWDPNVNADKNAFGNILVGLNYSPDPEHWRDTLFKLAATFKTAEAEGQPYDPFIVHFIWQVYMH